MSLYQSISISILIVWLVIFGVSLVRRLMKLSSLTPKRLIKWVIAALVVCSYRSILHAIMSQKTNLWGFLESNLAWSLFLIVDFNISEIWAILLLKESVYLCYKFLRGTSECSRDSNDLSEVYNLIDEETSYSTNV